MVSTPVREDGPLISIPVRKERRRGEQREKLGCDAVPVKASAVPHRVLWSF